MDRLQYSSYWMGRLCAVSLDEPGGIQLELFEARRSRSRHWNKLDAHDWRAISNKQYGSAANCFAHLSALNLMVLLYGLP
jgi:hypothetical protein